ncbi:hypothetical protein OCH239_20575 [Roseivivax halodurans JCM 10272]|uniref:Uncharacterized protein n=1 Tax=Roseivivax halodurans JCM 10272 TaxID=1449350 RepID=X7EIE6_9RHOB|nr:hypothetical protein [Roseivivax halodurans]ETX14888.1 hypothetical protein OCH239_20575 [Roseivivax halodurans JCM 10272]
MKKHTPASEIEDVLSSIRRLISEGTRDPAGEGGDASASEVPALVLTPQQRIGDDAARSEPKPMMLDNPLILPGDETAGSAREPLDTGTDRGEGQPDEAAATTPRSDPSERPVVTPATGGASDDGRSPAPGGFGNTPEEGVGTSPQESEAEMTAVALHALHGHETREDVEEARVSHALEDKLAELEAIVLQADDGRDAVPEPAPNQVSTGGTTGGTHAGATLDEEALRQLIAEVVREELQGALGERVTRNLRKLVRREIERALATRDVD